MLTDTTVKNAKPQEKDYKLSDTGGLYLFVKKTGGKLWRYNYRFAGKQLTYAIGAYPIISLKEARERQLEAKKLIANGINPNEEKERKKQTLVEQQQEVVNTFASIAEQWGASWQKMVTERHHEKVWGYLVKYVFPAIGDRPVNELKRKDFQDVIKPLESIAAVARKTLSACGQVMEYALNKDLVEINPTIGLRKTLHSAKTKHYAAITKPEEIGRLLAAIDDYTGHSTVRLYLQILPYVFCRPGELRLAEWSEIDFKNAVWNIPKMRMKKRIEHNVPLAGQVVALLRELQTITGDGKLLFPGTRSKTKAISDMTATNALSRMGYSSDEQSPHGFRAMARTVLAERLNMQPEWIECQLAHKVPGPLGATYARATYLEQRKAMMQQWANYLDELKGAK